MTYAVSIKVVVSWTHQLDEVVHLCEWWATTPESHYPQMQPIYFYNFLAVSTFSALRFSQNLLSREHHLFRLSRSNQGLCKYWKSMSALRLATCPFKAARHKWFVTYRNLAIDANETFWFTMCFQSIVIFLAFPPFKRCFQCFHDTWLFRNAVDVSRTHLFHFFSLSLYVLSMLDNYLAYVGAQRACTVDPRDKNLVQYSRITERHCLSARYI